MSDIVNRLRDQAQAPGHVWVDVMLLLLDAANEIVRLRAELMTAGNELDDLKSADFRKSLRDRFNCR